MSSGATNCWQIGEEKKMDFVVIKCKWNFLFWCQKRSKIPGVISVLVLIVVFRHGNSVAIM